jgi:hypothetical protein
MLPGKFAQIGPPFLAHSSAQACGTTRGLCSNLYVFPNPSFLFWVRWVELVELVRVQTIDFQ